MYWLFGIMLLITIILMSAELNGAAVIVFSILMVSIIAYILFKRNKKYPRCKECKKWFALRLTNSQAIDEEEISILVENKSRNKDGEIISTHEQYIPGRRIRYENTYKCKYCGCEHIGHSSKDIKNI